MTRQHRWYDILIFRSLRLLSNFYAELAIFALIKRWAARDDLAAEKRHDKRLEIGVDIPTKDEIRVISAYTVAAPKRRRRQ